MEAEGGTNHVTCIASLALSSTACLPSRARSWGEGIRPERCSCRLIESFWALHEDGQAAELKCEAAVKNNTADLMEEMGQVIATELCKDVGLCKKSPSRIGVRLPLDLVVRLD